MLRALLLCVLFGLASCSSAPPLKVKVLGTTLVYSGDLTEEGERAFQAALDAGPVTRVAISSGGGHVEPAIRMARSIFRRALEVEVYGPCFSSCANYIFPAGRRKWITGQGVVGWHGNMHHLIHLHDTGVKTMDPRTYAEIRRLAARETEFFNEIGVDQQVCWFAKMAPYAVRNLYFLDVDDMARFGIKQVSVRADYARTDLSQYNNGAQENLRYIHLN